MSFANLTWPWLLAGAAGLAGLLYVLQQLRIRYTEVAVPTAMFWLEAARDAPVRVFRRRFPALAGLPPEPADLLAAVAGPGGTARG